MSDEIKKDEAADKESGNKSKTVKKTTASKKEKASVKADAEHDTENNKIIDKLKAMGVMRSEKNNNDVLNSDKNILPFVVVMSVVVVMIVGYLVWTLNKNIEVEQVATNMSDAQSSSQHMPQYSNRNDSYPYYNRELQQRMQSQQEQYNKWVQQQQKNRQMRMQQQKKKNEQHQQQ